MKEAHKKLDTNSNYSKSKCLIIISLFRNTGKTCTFIQSLRGTPCLMAKAFTTVVNKIFQTDT